MRTLKFTIEYDGTAYVGWQVQAQGVSIQGLLESALSRMTHEKVSVIGAGRTDAGVHAKAQVASFKTHSQIPCENFLRALPSLLPPDIVVTSVTEADEKFNARKDAKGKCYHYLLFEARVPSALLKNRAWHHRPTLNLKSMRSAAAFLKGKHDFKAFMGPKSFVQSTVRTIRSISMSVKKERHGKLISLSFIGDGFLRNQIRNMVGTLVEVGKGKRKPASIKEILSSKKRTQAGMCAPACGLYLEKVFY